MGKDIIREVGGQRLRINRNMGELEITVDKFLKTLVGQEPEGRRRVI